MPLVRRPAQPVEPTTVSPDVPLVLGQGTNEQRWLAVRAAADRKDGASLLASALQSERDARVRDAIFTGLARIGTAESAAALVPYLRSDDASLRTGAADALRAMPGAVRGHLRTLLADPDPDVRLLSCELTRGLPEGEANRLLCELLEREAEKNVCAAALEVLAEIGKAEALPTLERCAERFGSDAFIAFSIKVATDRIVRT
jgi:HEAT repeat protein